MSGIELLLIIVAFIIVVNKYVREVEEEVTAIKEKEEYIPGRLCTNDDLVGLAVKNKKGKRSINHIHLKEES